MRILGIETSCDETSAAVVEETGDAAKPWVIRSNIVASQVPIHREWGGVVPELASRQHIRDICGVVERALGEARTAWRDLGAVAVPTTRLTHADRNAPELKGDLDFSFSGLKTAVLRHVRARQNDAAQRSSFTDQEIADICASFQRVVVSALIDRVFMAARRYQALSVGVAGGVSANSRL